MPSRHRSRQRALQILYLWDMRRQAADDSITAFYGSLAAEESGDPPERDRFADELAKGAIEETPEIDRRIGEHSENWRLERMPAVDRSILRLAIYEMMRQPTPPAVVIAEALALANRFSGEESAVFVNGVLDAVRRGLEAERASLEAG